MIPYLLIILAFAADRLSKLWAADYFAEHGSVEINQFFILRQTYNEGVAFGMFHGVGPVVGWLSLIVIIGLFVFLIRRPEEEWLVCAGLGLYIGGALGNMVDRIFAGRVLDFIESPLRWGIFNVADLAVNIGMVIILVGTVVHRQKNKPEDVLDSEPSEEPAPL
ncbi:MAG: signal peptidase II [Chloroflexi bacterium]|nr:signal peptidase II [Chloroflexota bacterium]